LLVQAANAEEGPKFEIGSRGEDAAERNIDVRFDRAPFRRKDIEERAATLEHPMYLGVRHLLVHDVFEDRARKDEVERIVGPRDLAHGRIAADIVGRRVEAKTLAMGRRAQWA